MLIPRALVLLAVCFATAHAAGLNDTGITFCGDASNNNVDCTTAAANGFPRQDAHFQKPFSFTKIANNGSELPASATLGTASTDWACTKDNVTGLIWEVKTTSGLRSQGNTYTNYDNTASAQKWNGSAYVNPAQSDIDASTNTVGYKNAVNGVGLCGANDWRMPKIKELESIVDLGRYSPAIDPTYFPNTPASYVWSGSPYAGDAGYAWGVNFNYGNSYGYYRSLSYGVRLVRGGQPPSAPLTVQTITFGTAPSLQIGGGTGIVTAMGGNSGNPVTFSSSSPSICAVDSSTGVVTPVAQGTCTIAANQVGNANYSAATQVTQDITVSAAATPPASSRYALVSNYAITDCVTDTQTGLMWEGKTASGTRAGSNTYTNYDSSYTGGTNINAATNSIGYMNAVNASNLCGFNDWRMPTKDELLTLVKTGSTPMIDTAWFPNLSGLGSVWSGSPFVSDPSGAWFVYFADGGAHVNGRNYNVESVRLVRGGQPPSAPLTAQTITFNALSAQTLGATPVALSASASSNLAVAYTSNSASVCTVIGSNVTLVSAGTCSITANQAGDSTYSAAAPVTQTFTVNLAAQSAFTATTSSNTVAYGGMATLGFTGGSGTGAVTYASNNANCTINGNTLTGAAAGSCVVTATKAADANYAQAIATVNITVSAPPSPPVTPTTPTQPTASTPPSTPIVPSNGDANNMANKGQELLVVGGTVLHADSNGTQVTATGVSGISTVAISSGSIAIPCTIASNFCQSGQTTVPIFAGESVKFTADGKVNSIEITPPTPSSSPARLNGKSLMDAVVETLQANVPTLGTETGRNANDWSALGIGFSNGKLSVSAQSPMQVNPALADGVSVLPNGTVQVTTQGVVVNLAPSLLDTARFTAALQNLSPNAQVRFGADGTMGISYNGEIYSVRPALFTTAPDSSQFTVGTDDVLRFDNQSIPPATYNFDQFATMLANLDTTAQVSVQDDGKLELVFKGVRYILSPDYQIAITNTPLNPGFVMRDGKLVVNYQFGFSQGFTFTVGQ